MKLVLFCLFAVGCWCLADMTASKSEEKLREVLRELRLLRRSLQHNELELNTPPQNIEECCCLSALHCFRENLIHLNVTKKIIHVKLHNSLRSPLTEIALNFCDSGDARLATCQTCESQPKQNSTVFIDRLESLIEKALVRLVEIRQRS